MSQKNFIITLFGLVTLAIILAVFVVLFQIKLPVDNSSLETVLITENKTGNTENIIKENITTTTTKENVSTTTDLALFRGFENKGLLISFKDGYEYPEMPDGPEYVNKLRDMIMFGPQRTIEDQIRQEISVRPYQLKVIPFRGAKEIITAVKAEGPRSEEPAVISINNLTGVEYSTLGICDGREIEIVGVNYNYLFSYDNCGSIDDISKRDYLIDVIKTAQIIK